MFQIIMKNQKPKIYYSELTYHHHFSKEGYYFVSIMEIDTSTIKKDYISLYLYEYDEDAIYRVQLRTINNQGFLHELPLKKIVELSLEEDKSDDIAIYSVDFKDLISLDFQIRVERENQYYNITKVFHKAEELGEFVPKKTIFNNSNNKRLPNGVLNHGNIKSTFPLLTSQFDVNDYE